jgi:hypothetical protein
MSETKKPGRKPADPNKPKREIGPRKLYVILSPGADKAAVKASIANVTFNGRKLLEAIANGDQGADFLMYTIEVEARGEKAAS